MGLMNARNLRRAKELLEKNRHKVGDVVGKAAEKADKVSGGKTANFSKKAEDAARKYSAGSSSTHHGDHPNAVSGGRSSGPMSSEEAQMRTSEAQARTANALAGLANAAGGLVEKAQRMADQAQAKADGKVPPTDASMAPPDASTVYTDNPPPLPDH